MRNVNHVRADPTSDRLYGKDLSPREREVMRSMLSGERVQDIAIALGLAFNTISTHRRRAQYKLGGKTKHHALMIFLKRELGISRLPWERG